MPKPKIFFIPTYIGPLKHYERLIPYLADKYEVGFLIVRPESERRREMVEYCRAKNYPCHIIDAGIRKDKRFRIPFFTPLKKRLEHSRACREWLQTIKPVKIISHKASAPYDTIFKEANRLGVETIVLQWSSDAGLLPQIKRRQKLISTIYIYLLKIISAVLDLFYQEPRFGYAPARIKRIGVFYPDKVREYIKKGYSSETIEIVGSPDLQLLHELKQKIDANLTRKEELFKKYGLAKERIKILVSLHRFYLLPEAIGKMTVAKHVAHHYELFKMIQEVFPATEAEVMLKLHPTENAMPKIYDPYRQLGVKLYYGQSRTEELMCLSDLYIGDPTLSVNYMALGCGVPAIFVNFSPWQFFNERAKYFYIKKVVNDKKEFIEKLWRFKRGTLEKQYDDSQINLKSLGRTLQLIER